MQPQVLVTSDGRLITPAPQLAVYPGPLLPSENSQSITQDGIDKLIDAARSAGLLANRSYESNQNIADASTATLRITADGETFVHEAYALGAGGGLGDELGEQLAPEREAFAAFIASLGDIPALVGADALGPIELHEPSSYQLFATPAGDLSGFEIEPTVVEWPTDTGIVLAEITQCVEAETAVVGELLTSANQLTFFTENDVNYQIVARPAYPGRSC